MNSSEPEELSENIEVVTPGDMLREARIALKLSLGDISKKLNLREALIEAIEANEFDEIPSVTFTRGYLKAYAKLLGLSEEDVLEAFEYLHSVEQTQLEMQSFSNRSSQKAADNWLSIVTVLVALVIITLAVVWWWQRNEGTNAANENQSGADTEQVQSQGNQGISEMEQALLDVQDAKDEPIDSYDAPSDEALDSAGQNIERRSTDSEQVQISALEKPTDDGNEPPQQLSELELRFADNCWINVSDATGERLAIGTKVKGHVSTVQGVAPFTIKLGKPDVVTVFLNGEQRKIPYYPKGSIANFTLSDQSQSEAN